MAESLDAYGGTLSPPTMAKSLDTYGGISSTPTMAKTINAYAGTLSTPSTAETINTFGGTLSSPTMAEPLDAQATSTISNDEAHRLTLLTATVLSDNECDVSQAPVLDPNLNNVSEGRSNENEAEPPIVTKSMQDNINVTDVYDTSNVFFVHPTSIEEPPTYSASINANEFMPSLLLSRFFEPKLNSSIATESDVRGSRAIKTDDDVPMNHFSKTPEVPTDGTIPYRGLSHTDGKTCITFEGLTKSKAEAYLQTEISQYNDYHLVYMPNVVHAIESYCFCQDELITMSYYLRVLYNVVYNDNTIIH
ncbi:hypothetical protein EV702DRAFT_1043677 [Suillus placidus]|uniref:Uncharacterized protein n=1 Tax=Suillus placidus TaxID=48579 RepID=A0A9P6ZZQ0_9AGAM|nr:hypothetical protein EV702DRAFT_1043677 [Suillus placidus]